MKRSVTDNGTEEKESVPGKATRTKLGSPAAEDGQSPNSQPTLQHIADRSGVSVTTISRVLSDQASRYRISKKTEAAVRKIAQECHFVPNQVARSLRLKQTRKIGLVIPDISNPFFAGIARRVTLGSHEHGYSVVLCDSEDSIQLEEQSIALLQSQSVEGIVVCPVGVSGKHLTKFVGSKMPIVLVDRFFENLDLPYVSSDNATGAKQATELLIANGHRRIACLQGLRGTSPNESRVRGYREAMAAHQLPVDERLIVGDSFTEQSGYIETKLLLKTQPDVTAILACSNVNALGAIRALAEEKRRIPEDMSLISFDDTPYSAYLATPLTTVAQTHAEMGEYAVKLLFDQIISDRGLTKGGILLPTNLIMRKSVKRLQPRTE